MATASSYIGESYYTNDDGVWAYELRTDPPEAAYWSTYKLKVSHVKVLSKADRSTAAALRAEILADIQGG